MFSLFAVGVRVPDLRCVRVDGEACVLRTRAAAATRDLAHLRRLLEEQLETIDPSLGIERLMLVAIRIAPMAAAEGSTEDEAAPPLARLIDRMGAQADGPECVFGGWWRGRRSRTHPPLLPRRNRERRPALAVPRA